MRFRPVSPALRASLAGALLAAFAFACGPEVINTGFPVFKIQPSSVDFGVVCIAESREQQFSILNDGAVGLQITKSELKGEGFSLVEPLPEFVGPIGEHIVTVRFDSTQVDPRQGSIVIETDDPENPKRTVTLGGEGFDGDRFDLSGECERKAGEPFSSLCAGLNFTDENNEGVLAGTSRDRTLRLKNDGCADVTVHSIDFVPDEALEGTPAHAAMFRVASPALPLVVKGGATQDVSIRFTAPPGDAQFPFVKMRVTSSDPSFGSEQGTKVYGLLAHSVAPALLVEPNTLSYYDATQGVPRTKTFSIRNTGTSTLNVTGVTLAQAGTTDYALDFEGAGPPFTLSFGETRDIKVVYTATGTGSDRATVTVTAAGSDPQTVELFGGADPIMVVTWAETSNASFVPPPVDFGMYDPGAACTIPTVTRVVKIANTGRAALEVTAIRLPADENPGGGYKLVGATPGSVTPGATMEFSVEFKDALTIGNDRAKIEITSNDATDAVVGGKRVFDLESRNAPNLPPNAVGQVPPGAAVNRPLTVSGSGSSDPTPTDVLTYAWRIIPGTLSPTSSTIRLESPTAVDSRIISDAGPHPDVAAEFRLELVVSDQCGQKSTPWRTLVKISP